MRLQIFNAQVVWNLEISLRKRRHKTYLPRGPLRKYLVIQFFLKWQHGLIKQNKTSNKGFNVPFAHNVKYLYKTIMHSCIGVCVDIKLVPLIFLKLSCSTCHKNVV